jgi:hypothetical protein
MSSLPYRKTACKPSTAAELRSVGHGQTNCMENSCRTVSQRNFQRIDVTGYFTHNGVAFHRTPICYRSIHWYLRTRSYFTTDGRSVSQYVLFLFFCREITLLFFLGRPLWREDGSVICSTICQWSESWRTHNHTLLSRLRLLGSLSIASYDSQGLQSQYSYPPPHGDIFDLHLNILIHGHHLHW